MISNSSLFAFLLSIIVGLIIGISLIVVFCMVSAYLIYGAAPLLFLLAIASGR